MVRIASGSLLVSALLACSAGVASAQLYSSGLWHTPMGSATFGIPEGRRLPVNNIGSSGQDGVEITLHSMFGGGTGVTVGDLPIGASLRHRYKGWDGTIKGHIDMTRLSNGMMQPSVAFPGATAIRAVTYDTTGLVVGDVITPGGGPLNSTPVPYGPCPDGSWPQLTPRYYISAITHLPTVYYVWSCVGPNGETNTYTYEGRRANTTYEPVYPVGTFPDPSVESVIITGGGIPGFTLEDASLSTFNTEVRSLGDAQLSEVCSPGTTSCAPSDRRLPVRNLGSSGQDGVEIKWTPASVATVPFELVPNPAGYGMGKAMYEWIKPSWDNPKREIYTIQPDPSGMPRTMITIDRSELGDSLCSVNGTIGGSPSGGTGGGGSGGSSSSIIIYIDGMYWGTYDHVPFWVKYFLRTTIGGIGGNGNTPTGVTVIANGMVTQFVADSIDIDFTDMPSGVAMAGMELTQPLGGDLIIHGVSTVDASLACAGDFNADGFLDFTDFDAFVSAFESGDMNADFNGDGFLDFTDFDAFVAAFESGC